MAIARHFQIAFTPVAEAAAVVRAPQARFTVITSRLIRMEYDPAEQFEDRASQVFWYRRQPVPHFTVQRENDLLTLDTGDLLLAYRPGSGPFSRHNLAVTLKAG